MLYYMHAQTVQSLARKPPGIHQVGQAGATERPCTTVTRVSGRDVAVVSLGLSVRPTTLAEGDTNLPYMRPSNPKVLVVAKTSLSQHAHAKRA